MKKIIPYILILSVLVGIFSPIFQAQAQTPGTCTQPDGTTSPTTSSDCPLPAKWAANSTPQDQPQTDEKRGCFIAGSVVPDRTLDQCKNAGGIWSSDPTNSLSGTPNNDPNKTQFQRAVEDKGCILAHWIQGTVGGCIVQVFYLLLYQLPAFLLAQTAYFFNVLISVTLNGNLFNSPFVGSAWAVVRDLSNIFFILILLYVAIKLILGLGGHDGQKMIASVILMALLINFSMFFTKVVIDSSNILGLIFYNKLNVDTTANGVKREYAKVGNEKDVAGGMVAAFDPTTTLKPEFFDQAKKVFVNGQEQFGAESSTVPTSTLVALILMAGLIMCFSIYALFVSGLSFLGRLIELWVVIIFSPFAFTSYTIPLLGKIEYLGWSSWVKRLLSSAFMAPIFMFFLYFIFLLIKSNVFSSIVQPAQSSDASGMIKMLLGVVLPTLLILILLLKATSFAKKGSGAIGGAIISGATKLAGLAVGGAAGLAVGVAASGAARAGRATVGRVGSTLGNAEWTKKTGVFGRGASNIGKFAASRSFDVRKAPGVEGLAKKAGINLGAAKTIGLGPKEGGFAKAREEKVEKRIKRAKDLEVGEDEKLKQELNKTERDLQSLLNANVQELTQLDKAIEKKRQTLRDTTAQYGAGSTQAQQAGRDLQNSKNKKKALKDAVMYTGDMDILTGAVTTANAADYRTRHAGGYTDSAGVFHTRTMNYMEDYEIPERKEALESENRERKWAYADSIEKKWFGRKANREASHKIRMGAKLEAGKGEKH